MQTLSKLIFFAACVSALFLPDASVVQAADGSHAARIEKYEGPATCKGCHPNAAKEVAESLHYQQIAETPFLVDAPKGNVAGMMKSY